MRSLDVDQEVLRLYKHKRKSVGGLEKTLYSPKNFKKLTYNQKIKELGLARLQGWYGEEAVARRILKDKYEEVLKAAVELLSQEKQGL